MATLQESAIFEEGIFQLEKSTPPLGGAPSFNGLTPIAGHANAQALQLANRTTFLKNIIDLLSGSAGASNIFYLGKPISAYLEDFLSSHERLLLKKKKTLSLPMKHPEWDYLLGLGIRFYPQAFCLDEDAGKLLIIDGSTPSRTVLMYDWPSGNFDRVFFCTADLVTEGAVVVKQGNTKYLYMRSTGDALARWDITSYPASRATIGPQSLTVGPNNTKIPCGLNLMYRNGIWTISDIASGPLNNVRSRGKFARYDSNFNLLGSIDCGDLLMGVYAGRAGDTTVTKTQGVTDTGYGLIAQMGGQWVVGNTVTAYSQNGMRVFTYDGNMVEEGLLDAKKYADSIAANWGFTPALIESEGIICDNAGNVYSLVVTSNNGVNNASSTHGFLITQEFCFDGLDFSPAAAPRTSSMARRGSLIQTATGGVLFDNFQGSIITTMGQLLDSMQRSGLDYWGMQTTSLPLVDLNGAAYPSSCLLEVIMLSSTVFMSRLSGSGIFRQDQLFYDTASTSWKASQWRGGDGVNNFTGSGLTITRTDGGPSLTMSGPAANHRQIFGQTSSSNRWRLSLGDSSAEGGSDSGSNFALASYTDAGSFKAAPIVVSRSSGETQLLQMSSSGPIKPGQYLLSALPSASTYNGYEIDVTNASGGPKRCRSNGSVWQILNTTTTVS